MNTNAVTPVNRLFLVQYINGRKTEYRECIKCSDIKKCPTSGTSALNKHSKICGKKIRGKRPADQREIPFAKSTKVDEISRTRGLKEVSQLVRSDNSVVNAVLYSSVEFYERVKENTLTSVTHQEYLLSLGN